MNKTYKILVLIAMLLFAIEVPAKEIIIYHTNDLHANVAPFKARDIDKDRLVGGFANIASVVKQAKKAHQAVFYFDAGDFFTGPYISSLTNGEAIIDIMNLMAIDAATLGNHEFDYGADNLVTQLTKAQFPLLQGNVFNQNDGLLMWNKPWVILEKEGVKIGVIGLHGQHEFYDSISARVRQGVEARDENAYLKKYLSEIRDQVDIVVVLVHQGRAIKQSGVARYDIAKQQQKNIEMAKAIPGIDIVITGHVHGAGTVKPIKINHTLIVSTNAFGIDIGKLVINFNEKTRKIDSYKGELITLFADSITPDPETEVRINHWMEKLKTITQQEIAETPVILNRDYSQSSLVGNLVADAFLAQKPNAVIAFVNRGGLRSDIPAGKITLGDVISTLPFPDELVSMTLTGKQLKELLTYSADLVRGALQVSHGLEMIYDSTQLPGQRLLSLTLDGKALDDGKDYVIITNAFLAAGGDGFHVFRQGKDQTVLYGIGAAEAVTDYLKKQRRVSGELERRVIDVASSMNQ